MSKRAADGPVEDPKKHQVSDLRELLADQASTEKSESPSPAPLKQKKQPIPHRSSRIKHPSKKALENILDQEPLKSPTLPTPKLAKTPPPPAPKTPPPTPAPKLAKTPPPPAPKIPPPAPAPNPAKNPPPNPPHPQQPPPPLPPKHPRKTPPHAAVSQPFPELGEVLQATTNLPLPIRQIPRGVLRDLRTSHARILAEAVTAGRDRGAGIRKLLAFFRLVLTFTTASGSPETRIREKLRLWDSKQFQTLLEQVREANEGWPQRRRRQPGRLASAQRKRELALEYLQAGSASKVLTLVQPASFGGRDDIREEDMIDYFPQAVDNMNDVEAPQGNVPSVSPERVAELIRAAHNLKGPGPFGGRMEYLKAMFSAGYCKDAAGNAHLVDLARLMSSVNAGDLAREFPEIAPYFYGTRVVFLGDKSEAGKFRPIQVGESLAKLAAQCFLHSGEPEETRFDTLKHGPNLAVNTPGGAEAMVVAARACVKAQEANPHLVICEIDSKKAFQNIKRNKVVEAHLAAGQKRLAQEAYWRLSVHQIAVFPWGETRRISTGLPQGHPLSPSNFAAGAWLHQHECFQRCEETEPVNPLTNLNYADDNLFCAELLPALRYLDARLATAEDFGIFTNPAKSRIHVPFEVARGKQDIADLVEQRALAAELNNFTVAPSRELVCMQVPVGSREAETRFLAERIAETDATRKDLEGLSYPQAEYVVLKRCLGFAKMSWLLRVGRHASEGDTDPTSSVADLDDANILQSLSRILSMDPADASRDPTRSLISLSVRRGGLGVRLSREHHLIARMAALHLSIPTLTRISESFRGDEWLAPWRNLYESGCRTLTEQELWVPDEAGSEATVKHKQRLMSARKEEQMLAAVMESQEVEDSFKYALRCRIASPLDTTAFLDFFDTRLLPPTLSLLSADRLAHFAPIVRLFLHVPQNKRAHDCGQHKKPLGRLLEHALMCEKYTYAHLITDTLVWWFKRLPTNKVKVEQHVKGVGKEHQQSRPGDVAFRIAFTDQRIFVDHVSTSIFSGEAAKKSDLEPGSLALRKELGKYGKYRDMLVKPLPDFKDSLTAAQRHATASKLWKSEGTPFAARVPSQSFWPCGVEILGAPGPHYLVLLDYLAAALEGEAIYGPHLNSLLRRTMCKLLHDRMGQTILRKIEELR